MGAPSVTKWQRKGPLIGRYVGDHLKNDDPAEKDIDGGRLKDDDDAERDIDGDGRNDDAGDEFDIDGDDPRTRSRES